MNKEEIKKILKENDVVIKGHFLLRSGKHSAVYFEKYKLIEKPSVLSLLVKTIIEKFDITDIDKVVGPVTGGAIIGFEFARQLGVKFAIAEKENDSFVIRRGEGIKKGDRVIISEDVVTTGGSVKNIIKEVLRSEGIVTAVYSLIDRGESGNWMVPYFYLYQERIESFTTDSCPLCKKGIPLRVKGGKITS